MSIILDGTNGITSPNETVTGQFSSGSTFGFKNRIINGGMVIDQRNAGAASANTISGYFLDRWTIGQGTSGKLIAQQNQGSITPPVGFSNYLGVTSQSAYTVLTSDIYSIQQIVEGFNISDLWWGTANAQTVTLSFWVRSSLTGTFGGSLTNTGAITYAFTYSIPVANTWTQISITVVGATTSTWSSTNTAGLYVRFGLGGGSGNTTSTLNSWISGNFTSTTGAVSVVGTSGATFYITGVQLEKGSVATSFDQRAYSQELAMCQRYAIDVAGKSLFSPCGTGFAISSTVFYTFIPLQFSMRSTPSLDSATSSGASFQLEKSGSLINMTAIALVGSATASSTGLYLECTVASGLTANEFRTLRNNNSATAKIILSAEL